MGSIQDLAGELGGEERTLRRAASQGTLRCRRTRPRQLQMASGEPEYLRDHWPVISALRRALRTQRGVRLAVLYGSFARGDDDLDSDLDLLVKLDRHEPLATARLAAELERSIGRQIDIADLDRIEAASPVLLNRVLEEGRVLVDRAGHWPQLLARRRAIRARAQRAHRRQLAEAETAIEELIR